MSMIAIYDDRIRVPEEARAFVGVEHFSQLVFRKRTLAEHMTEMLVAAGIENVTTIASDEDARTCAERLQRGAVSQRVVYVPASLTFLQREAALLCLRKIALSEDHFAVAPDGNRAAPVLLTMGATTASRYLMQFDLAQWSNRYGEGPCPFLWMENKMQAVDLSARGRLIDFMSSTFDARNFNRIAQDDLLVTKRSPDIGKMRREFGYYTQLEGPIRMFFLQPLSYREGPDWAEYQTERLFVPDVAIQWIHRSFDHNSFATLLRRLRAYLAMRPLRTLTPEAGVTAVDELYPGKIAQRLDMLKQSPLAATIERMAAQCPGVGSTAALFARYRHVWKKLSGLRRSVRQAVSHGDLCFSNILYHRQSQQLKCIDPRGATSPEDVWLDEYYDVAKLSHSVLGLYDLINHDLVELRLDRNLQLELVLDVQGLRPLQQAFRESLADAGFDLRLVRLYEASLFLSMLPLHADVPKKVIAFLLTAAGILDELERT